MLNLAGDLTFGVCVTFSSAALPGRVLQELWAGERAGEWDVTVPGKGRLLLSCFLTGHSCGLIYLL